VSPRPPGRGARGGDKADPAETAAARLDHRLQHPFDRRTQRQIGVADDAGADLGLAVCPACRHCRDTIGELDFADRTQLGGPRGAVHGQPFEVDGRGDVVTAAGVGEQVGQQIAAGLGPVDQMMVRVDGRQLGFDDRLAALVEPRPQTAKAVETEISGLSVLGAATRRYPSSGRAL
jgi:hypothetical protein